MFTKFLTVGSFSLSYLFQSAGAAPALIPRSASSLTKRDNTFIGCDGNQRTKAALAVADMANLASIAYTEASTDKYGYAPLCLRGEV